MAAAGGHHSTPWPHSAPTTYPAVLAAHIGTMTTLLDTMRAIELNIYITFYGASLGGC